MKCMVMLGNLIRNVKFINVFLVADYEKFYKTLHDNCVKHTDLVDNSLYVTKLKALFYKRFEMLESH